MIIVLSPSKTLDFSTPPATSMHSTPRMLKESEALVKLLRKYPAKKLGKLMDISDKLAALNMERFKDFSLPFTPANARQALLAFKGDVYAPMKVASYSKDDFTFAQAHVRILSGLYGLLKPLDLIQPYRLEMGTVLPNPRGKDLYHFWGKRITELLNADMKDEKSKILINLASEEYFSGIIPQQLAGKLLNVVFKEKSKGQLKIIGLFAKKARGMMTDYVIKNRITVPEKNEEILRRWVYLHRFFVR